MFQGKMQTILSGIILLKYMLIPDMFQFQKWPFGNRSQWLWKDVPHGENKSSEDGITP